MKRILIAGLLASVIAPPAMAAKWDDLYREGQFAAAADAARAADTPDSLALAAQATLVMAAYQADTEERALTLIGDAIADADTALYMKPNHVGALLQKAIGVGYRAQLSKSPSKAKEALRLMTQAAKADPKNAMAQASIGGWHSGAIGQVGGFAAKLALGASEDKAIAAFEKALALDGKNPIWRAFYAMGLIDMGEDSDVQRLRRILAPAAAMKPRNGFERLLINRARQLLAVVDDKGELEEVAEANRPFAQFD